MTLSEYKAQISPLIDKLNVVYETLNNDFTFTAENVENKDSDDMYVNDEFDNRANLYFKIAKGLAKYQELVIDYVTSNDEDRQIVSMSSLLERSILNWENVVYNLITYSYIEENNINDLTVDDLFSYDFVSLDFNNSLLNTLQEEPHLQETIDDTQEHIAEVLVAKRIMESKGAHK